LGEDGISDADIAHLAGRLTDGDKELLPSEGRRAAVWIYDVIKRICGR
jgi:hypothetical protein